MRPVPDIKLTRILVATLISGGVGLLGLWVMGRLSSKIQGSIIAAITGVFLASELFYWNAMKALNETLLPDVLTARHFEQLAAKVNSIKALLRNRFLPMVILKIISGVCAAVLIQWTDTSNLWSSLLVFCALVSIALSVPLALGSYRAWREADDQRTALMIFKKKEAERGEQLRAIKNPASLGPY